MEIKIIDIWLDKIQNYGWKIEDAPNEEIRKELRRRLEDNGIKEVKKFFKNEVEVNHNSNDAFFFCIGYTVALYNNSLITDKEREQLRKYILRRAERRER